MVEEAGAGFVTHVQYLGLNSQTMVRLVPQTDNRSLSLVAEDRQGGSVECEQSPARGIEAAPARRQNAQQMPVGEEGDISVHSPHQVDDTVDAAPNLLGGFALGNSVTPDGPAGDLVANVDSPTPLIRAVVPLPQVRRLLGRGSQPCQPACLGSTLEGAGQHSGEAAAAKQITERACLVSSHVRQGDIRVSGVPAGAAPLGLAVSHDHDLRTIRQNRPPGQRRAGPSSS
jgi:hypothetical protein